MNIRYDKKQNALYIDLAKGTYEKSKKITDSILVDMDKNQKILGIEILDATENINYFDPSKLKNISSVNSS